MLRIATSSPQSENTPKHAAQRSKGVISMTPSLLPWDLISTGENSIDLRCRRQSQQRCRSDRHEPLERRAVSNGSFMLSGWIPACRTLETLAALDSVRGTFACET